MGEWILMVTVICHRSLRGHLLGECGLVTTLACQDLSEAVCWVNA